MTNHRYHQQRRVYQQHYDYSMSLATIMWQKRKEELKKRTSRDPLIVYLEQRYLLWSEEAERWADRIVELDEKYLEEMDDHTFTYLLNELHICTGSELDENKIGRTGLPPI